MNYKKNPAVVEIAQECGFYVDVHDPDITWKEVEFLCEMVARTCAEMVSDFSERDAILRSFNLLKYHD
jgi:hypothetical protein